MTNQPLVSIIIPTYNRAHLIGETLDSILAQTYINWECIVVDDGSTDGTEALMASYIFKDNRFQYHHRPADRLPGGNAARNYGFELSKGKYVQWFDSDDLMLPNFLLEKVKFFEINSTLEAVCAYGAYFETDKQTLDVRKPQRTGRSDLLDYVNSKFFLTTNGPLWKGSFLKSKFLFDEQRMKIQDIEFHFRMLLTNLKFGFIEDEFLFLIRRGNNRVSSGTTLTTKKLEDVLDYHYFTYQNYKALPAEFVTEYKIITMNKTLRAFYNLVITHNKIYQRVYLLKKHKWKIYSVISASGYNFFKKQLLYLTIISVILIRKGYSFFK